MDHLGQMIIKLTDYFSFPSNFTELFNEGNNELKSIFNISLAANPFHLLNYTIEMVSYTTAKIVGIKSGKKIGDISIKELVGSSFE
jgi:hypothetical protein